MAELKAFVQGAWVPEGQASVSVFDHGFLYGDGVFEGIRAYNGRVFKLEEHLDRLYKGAKAIALDVPYTRAEMRGLILEACRVNGLRDAYIRPIVSRGVGDLGLDPRKCKQATVLILARPSIALYPQEKYQQGLKLVTCSTRRTHPQTLSPNIKSLNYLNNILARIEANHANADEGLMLDMNGFVSEATADNVFIVNNEVVYTPRPFNTLVGVTRQAVMEIARAEGFGMEERQLALMDVYTADEVFITGTAAEVVPVRSVDRRVIGDGSPGKVTRHIMTAFRTLVRSTGTPIWAEEERDGEAPRASSGVRA